MTDVHISSEAMCGMAMRLQMLQTHYRKPINFTQQRLSDADKIYRKWLARAERDDKCSASVELLEALCDDMNTPLAITVLHKHYKNREYAYLFAGMKLLGLLPQSVQVIVDDLHLR